MAQRNSDGTFSKGWDGGPGRPAREVEQDYLTASMMSCTPVRWGEIVQCAVTDCDDDDDPRIRADARLFLKGIIFGKGERGVIDVAKEMDRQAEVNAIRDSASEKQEIGSIQWLNEFVDGTGLDGG